MKRTRKWAFMAQEAVRLAALGLSPYSISKRLGVSASTVSRWKHAGKLGEPAKPSKLAKVPSDWRTWGEQMRAIAALNPLDEERVKAGEYALSVLHDEAPRPTGERLQA